MLNLNKNTLFSILVLCCASSLFAQQPIPAKPQAKPILLLNGTAHLGDGKVIANAAIGFENGRLSLVADATTIRLDKSKFEIIDCSGKQIYPGFIAPNTTLGLVEVEAIRATLDNAETGSLNPNVRSIISYNTDSKVTPTVRSNGILTAQIVPQGGMLSGQSSGVMLDAWNWEDAAYKTDDGVHLNWPRMVFARGGGPEAEDAQRQAQEKGIQKLRALFNEAQAYAQSKPEEVNLRLQAMSELFASGVNQQRLFVHCDDAREIVSAVKFADDFGMKIILVGGADAWKVADLLKSKNIPVILGRLHALPMREDEQVDQFYQLPARLKQAGVLFCLGVDGFWQVRNLPFMAGTAATYGLTKEEALASITSSTAKILGLDARLGTLEVDKDATLFVSSGDALDMRSNQLSMAFIQGRKIDLNNIQTDLNQRYRNKYGLK